MVFNTNPCNFEIFKTLMKYFLKPGFHNYDRPDRPDRPSRFRIFRDDPDDWPWGDW